MIQALEPNATGPVAAAASAGLLLFSAWVLIRSRHNPSNEGPGPRRDGGAAFLRTVDGPPSTLALCASLFLHLVVLSLMPYVQVLAPEIEIRPPRSDVVLIEYRVPPGAVLDARWRLEPPPEPRSAERASGEADSPDHAHRKTGPVQPKLNEGVSGGAESGDIQVARFDSVIQVFPPAAPAASAIGESWEAPVFVLDWTAPPIRPSLAVLEELASIRQSDAALTRWKTLPEFAIRERFVLTGTPTGPPGDQALAEYGKAMKSLAVTPPILTGSFGFIHANEETFPALRLDAGSGRRHLPYLISLLLAPHPQPAPAEPSLGGGGIDGGIPVAGQAEIPISNRESTVQRVPPLERRRYGIILVGAGARGQIPAADDWLTGNPVYTIYLRVPGSPRKWVLQFCRPGRPPSRLKFAGGVIRLLPRRALDPPFARRTQAIGLDRDAGAGWQRAVVFARLDSAGALSDLHLVAGPEGETGKRILAVLRGWEFLPAFEDGKPVAVEAIFSIPLN